MAGIWIAAVRYMNQPTFECGHTHTHKIHWRGESAKKNHRKSHSDENIIDKAVTL